MTDRVFYPDADLRNADWPKRTWDSPLTVEDVESMPLQDLIHFMGLPVWEAAPDEIRDAASRRLSV